MMPRSLLLGRLLGRVRSVLLLVLVLVVAGPLAACAGSTSFKYIDVTVTIDSATISTDVLARIAACELEVRGVEMLLAQNLPCREGQVPYDLGKFQWSTTADAGSLQFFVRAYDINRELVGEGRSENVSLATTMSHVPASVLVKAVGQGTVGDGGALDGSLATDAGGE